MKNRIFYLYEDIMQITKSWKLKPDSWENNVKFGEFIDAQKFTLKMFTDKSIQHLDFLTPLSTDICEPIYSSYPVSCWGLTSGFSEHCRKPM